MRLLLLAYYFPPMGGMGSLRALSFATHLREAGIDVTVVAPRTGTWGHDDSLSAPPGVRVVRTGTLEPGVLARRLSRLGRDRGVTREMGGGRLRGAKGLLQRLLHVPDANVGWVLPAAAAARREALRGRFDVILSSSPPVSAHLAAAAASARLGAPLVLDVRDFFEEQRLFGGLRSRLDGRIEARILRRARGFVAPYRGILDALRERREAPAVEIRNGYDEEDFAGPAPSPATDAFRLVHVGTTYSGRADWRPLLSAVAAVVAEGRPIRLRFVGKEDPGLRRTAERCGAAGACEFAGYSTHSDAIREMRSASALLLFSWAPSGPAGRGLVLGKTFECLRAGPPILYVGAPDGANARLLARTGGAFARAHGDRAGIETALRALLDGRGPAPSDRAALAPFTRRAQALRLARWLSELIGSRG
jgi:glycosyltransferase involved in cell wall biosynthesis